MPQSASLARYLNPRRFKREQEELQRIANVRNRDGDDCRRCRRPMRFDLSAGHDQAPKTEQLVATLNGRPVEMQHLYLCHTRCNAPGADHTGEVTERVRRKNEADLFAKRRA
jgi:hypothetical protein